MEPGGYEILAIRYGHLARRSPENFVDAGFSDATAQKRSRQIGWKPSIGIEEGIRRIIAWSEAATA
jgi:nucleoside-diphosphate-sugar epimerase